MIMCVCVCMHVYVVALVCECMCLHACVALLVWRHTHIHVGTCALRLLHKGCMLKLVFGICPSILELYTIISINEVHTQYSSLDVVFTSRADVGPPGKYLYLMGNGFSYMFTLL